MLPFEFPICCTLTTCFIGQHPYICIELFFFWCTILIYTATSTMLNTTINKRLNTQYTEHAIKSYTRMNHVKYGCVRCESVSDSDESGYMMPTLKFTMDMS